MSLRDIDQMVDGRTVAWEPNTWIHSGSFNNAEYFHRCLSLKATRQLADRTIRRHIFETTRRQIVRQLVDTL